MDILQTMAHVKFYCIDFSGLRLKVVEKLQLSSDCEHG